MWEKAEEIRKTPFGFKHLNQCEDVMKSLFLAAIIGLGALLAPVQSGCPGSVISCPYDGQEMFPTGRVSPHPGGTAYEFAHEYTDRDGKTVRHTYWENCQQPSN